MHRTVAYWVTLGGLAAAFLCIHYGPLAVGAAMIFIALVAGAMIEGLGDWQGRRKAREKR